MKETDAEKLQKAATKGDLKTVERLLAATDWKPDRKTLNAALSCAAFWNRAEVMDRLLTAGANPEQTTLAGTLLMGAAMNGDLPLVKRLIKAGANIHREVKRETALSAALSENQTRVVKYLESLGASSPPTTSLLYASMHGDIERMKRAILAGADIEKRGGTFEETPLMAASRKGQTQAVKLLLKNGARPNFRIDGRTALFEAVESGKNPDVLEAFLEVGADIHIKKYDETLLMAAAGGGCLAIVKRLVELGADVHARDKNFGKTALDHAKDGKHKDIIAYLNTLGLKAARDPGRELVRALAREFGGKPIETNLGFLLDSRLAGHPCQFSIHSDGCSVTVFRLSYSDAELRTLDEVSITFSPTKPQPVYDENIQELRSIRNIPGIKLYRSGPKQSVPEEFVRAFSVRHRKRIEDVKLSAHESVQIGSSGMVFDWQGTEIEVVRPRLQAFASLIKAICRPPQPERRLFDHEWLLKPAKSSAATALRHSFGGKLNQPVACTQCDCATNLMVNLNLSDPALPKTAIGRRNLSVLWCLSCTPWEPSFHDISGAVPKPLDEKGRPLGRRKLSHGEDDLDSHPVTLVPVGDGKKAGRKSKIGGAPRWIQMEEPLDCPRCEGAMTFVMQLDSQPCMFGDMGILYTFVCPKCKIIASLVQSH